MTVGRAAAIWAFCGLLGAQEVPEWQAKAGGKAAFEVASVKVYKLSPNTLPVMPNIFLANGDGKPAGGRFRAAFPVEAYISFAWKLGPGETGEAFDHLPKWVRENAYLIEANAPGSPTKDQMRLMMQSLLADRFKLAVHFETREAPVLALQMIEPGKPGPKLIPHSQGPPCPDEYVEAKFDLKNPPKLPDPLKDIFPQNCGESPMLGGPDSTYFVGHRDTSMDIAAQDIYNYGKLAGEVNTPVIDQTGLQGRYDYRLEYKLDPSHRIFNPETAGPDPQGTPFLDAVKKQLGLKLVKAKAPVRTLVIDHIEMPSEN